MAIDFSQVKTITIPEGSVTKITDSTGNILWQGAGWHTVWEGNFSKTINSNSGRPDINICNLVDCKAPLKLRITGSINNTIYNPRGTFNWIGESSQSISSSTIPLNINKEINVTYSGIPASKLLIILKFECYRYRYENTKIEFYIKVDSNSKTLKFNVIINKLEDYTLTLNITKVEQYY